MEDEGEAVAVIPAAGAGKRMRGDLPKQFLPLKGYPLLVHTVQRFQSHSGIGRICLVVPEGKVDFCRREMVERFALDKVVAVVEGGEERQESVRKGLQAIEASCDRAFPSFRQPAFSPQQASAPTGGGLPELILVHDGVRPFVSARLIREVLSAARSWGAVVPALPCWDTLKEIDEQGVVSRTVDRAKLRRIQTPQCFRYAVLKAALNEALKNGLQGTDEASLVERNGHPVRVVPGDPYNFKMTAPEDFLLGEWLLERGWAPDSGQLGR